LGKQRKRDARSRVTNGADVLPNVDGRSEIARRFFDVLTQIISDQGGVERMAEVRLQLCRRFAACAVLAENQEAAVARGETINITEHAQLVSSLVRVSNRIGVGRRAKEVVPSLERYLADAAEAEAVDEEVQ
jgi:hypothetical protein